MSSFSISFISLVWPLLAILIGALEIGIAVLLLREQGPGPKIMLGGAVMGLLGHLSGIAVMFLMNQTGLTEFNEAALTATLSLTGLGSMAFAIGLLLHALHRRALANRIAELEAILASRDHG